MKILFAVNNDSISEAIVKKYQKEYKEILSYKNVYYFNAILREVQKDKSYSRIVISEDLEPFANNNYDSIDKFLFEKYSNITEEAKSLNNERIDIILICADRRKKTDSMLAKVYKKEIYNAIIGQDRSIDEVCRLINQPRDKERAKMYYGIQESELGETESENSVSEAEVENIRAHYARLGKNEDKYVDSFNNIVAQYTDTQLKIIIKYLPINVKAVLEERSSKYQQLVTKSALNGFDAKRKTMSYKEQIKDKNDDDEQEKEDVVEQLIKPKNIKSVVIPTNLTTANVQKVVIPKIKKPDINLDNDVQSKQELLEESLEDLIQVKDEEYEEATIPNEEIITTPEVEVSETPEVEKTETPEIQKRGRGRPRKNPIQTEQEQKPKRGRGRPRKNPVVTENEVQPETKQVADANLFEIEEDKEQSEDVNLFEVSEAQNDEVGLFEITDTNKGQNEDTNLFELEDEGVEKEETEPDLFNIEEESEVDLFNMNEEEEEQEIDLFNSDVEKMINESDSAKYEETKIIQPIQKPIIPAEERYNNVQEDNYMQKTFNTNSTFNTLLTADKKVVAFVGTTKNGTSFVVNNTAEMLASMGIETAILDMTKTKNAYYIYTNNEESLRTVAKNCMENLQNGIADGIKVRKNLTVYTEMPGEEKEYEVDTVLSSLVKKYSAILIDTDFDTAPEIFERVQEIYLVQTMDVLTIQPLTAFLRNLKSKDILRPEKLKIVINKSQKVRSLNIKTLIGGMSCYNSPSMTYMTELFNKDNIKYCEIPFEVQNYVKYLDSLVNCSISLNGYTKQFLASLKELANMVYPLVNKQPYSPIYGKKEKKDPFSSQVNDTLNKMKNRY